MNMSHVNEAIEAYSERLAVRRAVAAVGADRGRCNRRRAVSVGEAAAAQPKSAAQKTQPKGPARPPDSRNHQKASSRNSSISPWTKVCQKGPEPNAKQVCFIGKDGRVESGMPVVAAVLIEPEGEPRKSPARHAAARHGAPARHARDRRPAASR